MKVYELMTALAGYDAGLDCVISVIEDGVQVFYRTDFADAGDYPDGTVVVCIGEATDEEDDDEGTD